MKPLLALAAFLAVAVPVVALDPGQARPPKPPVTYPVQAPDPERQGGDTIADAVAVFLPVHDLVGTTVGYTDDYDEQCPYVGSTSPDVVYSLSVDWSIHVVIDLLGSTYDTKLYVYDEDLALVACNDDYYPDYVSRLDGVPLDPGTYFIVIDGYGGAAGDYVLNIDEFIVDVVTCPGGAELEGEPTLVDGYVDAFNGGCNSPEAGNPFGAITRPVFCGQSGWYLSPDGSRYRDTDWFEIVVPDAGFLEITGDANFTTYLFELGPQDCGSVAVIQNVICGPFQPATMTIPGAPGSTVWFWVGPTTFDGPTGEYLYVLWSNLEPAVAVAPRSWSAVKGLFD
ncbi:MAG: hypothetical protein R3D98_11045 [Candidatus Krumholzibacteriia bacterium]